jgi:hypothetical protein
MFNKPTNFNENNSINSVDNRKLKNDKNSNEEFNLLCLIICAFSIKNGLLGVNRTIFLKLLKFFKTKNKDKIRSV